jgi:hypothetical protein
MNAGSPQKIRSASEFINAVEQFHKKCENKTVEKNDVDQFVEIISSTSRPTLDSTVATSLEGLKKTMGSNKAVIEKAGGAVPYQNITTKIDDLSRYLKEEKEMKSKVTSKDNEGLPGR